MLQDFKKKSFDEHIIRFYINYINKKLVKGKNKIIERTTFKKLEFIEKIKNNSESIERKIQEEINRAIERATKNLEFEVMVEEPEIVDDKLKDKKEEDREIRVRYATEERLEVNYTEIFSYLNTRPNLVNYEYEFMEKKEEEDGDLTPLKVAKINQIRRLDKVVHCRDMTLENPEGIDPILYEKFLLYRLTFEGRIWNQFYYDDAFAAPM